MAEEQNAGGQNLWLLLVSLGLGLIVVVIYNVHIWNVRNSYKGQQIELISLARDVDAGEKLRAEDLEVRTVPKQYQESLGTVVTGENCDFTIGQQVNRSLEKGRWLLWDYITGGQGPTPAAQIPPGWVAKAVELDSKRSPGDILRTNDRVNILGFIEGKACRLIKGVTVLAVGGYGVDLAKIQKSNVATRTPKNYNSITVTLPEDVALQWDNLLTHVKGGSCWVELRPANEQPSPDFNRINPDLKKLGESAAAPTRGEWSPGGTGGGTGGGTDGVPVPGSKTWE
jgi:Flp pilus assembly protein CpaB